MLRLTLNFGLLDKAFPDRSAAHHLYSCCSPSHTLLHSMLGCAVFIVYDNNLIVVLTMCELILSGMSLAKNKQKRIFKIQRHLLHNEAY